MVTVKRVSKDVPHIAWCLELVLKEYLLTSGSLQVRRKVLLLFFQTSLIFVRACTGYKGKPENISLSLPGVMGREGVMG